MDCTTFEAKIIDYLDGDLSKHEQNQLDSHLESCHSCQTVLAKEKAVIQQLQLQPHLDCPDAVISRTLNYISKQETSWLEKYSSIFKPDFSWETSLATAVALILIITLAYLPYLENRHSGQDDFTVEEIARATSEAQLALAYFHFYAKKTEAVIEEQVLPRPVLNPIKSIVKKAIKPLINGGQL